MAPPGPRPTPSLPSALRSAAFDFYQHSIRLVPANVLWGVGFALVVFLSLLGGPVLTAVTGPFLGIPLVGIYRLAGHAGRGEDVVLSDALAGMRERLVPALVAGAVTTWASLLLALNLLVGFGSTMPLGWAFGTAAAWGLIAIAIVSVAFWPILGDPARRALSLRDAGKLAGLVVLAAPFRILRLALVVTVLAVVSTVLFAAIVSISVAFIALVSSRIVLAEADRLAALRPDLVGAAGDS